MSINYSLTKKNSPLGKDAGKKQKLYAIAQHNGKVDADHFYAEVCRQFRSYGEGEVYGVLYAVAKTLRRLLLDGRKVEAGPLGDFYTVINGRGSANRANFARSNIKDVKVNWAAGKMLSGLMREAKFKQVIPREIQMRSKREAKRKLNEEMHAARKDKGLPEQQPKT